MAEVKLRVTTSTGQQTLDGDQEFVVGRGREADVSVAGGSLSRRHVLLVRGPRGWVATDASANGMWQGGERVDTVAVGDREVTLHLG
nr:FHA domain-containing protein [Micromonospora sp. DSM 115978]